MKEIISEQLNLDTSDLSPETSFKDDLGADSLDLFELVMALEEEYNMEIPTEDLADMETIGDVMDYLRNKGVEAYQRPEKPAAEKSLQVLFLSKESI